MQNILQSKNVRQLLFPNARATPRIDGRRGQGLARNAAVTWVAPPAPGPISLSGAREQGVKRQTETGQDGITAEDTIGRDGFTGRLPVDATPDLDALLVWIH